MIAIIPARGNSKGLPDKNIKNLFEKPLIAYSIEAALKSKLITRVIVSTDNVSIAKISLDYGAEVPFMRPDVLATDESKAIDTYNFTIDKLQEIEGNAIENIIVLLPTSPLRTSEDIDNAILLFLEKKADSVVSYTPEHHPILWHKYISSENKFISIFEENTLRNRQDLKESFYPNGSIFIFKTSILKSGKYYTNNSFAYIMPRSRSIDIDTIEDFEYAEFLINKRNKLC